MKKGELVIGFSMPEYDIWTCHTFGSNGQNGISWRPTKGNVPNFFWRWMQYLCFGNTWVKDKKVHKYE